MKLLPFALLFIATACSFQQDPELIAPDSKEAAQELIVKSQKLAISSIEDALDLSDKAVTIIEEQQYDDLKPLAYNNQGYLLNKKGAYTLAAKSFIKTLDVSNASDHQIAYANYKLGRLLVTQGFVQQAIPLFETAFRIYTQIPSHEELFLVSFRLSIAYSTIQDLEAATVAAERAKDIAIDHLDEKSIIKSSIRLLYYQIETGAIDAAKTNVVYIENTLSDLKGEDAHRLHMFQAEIAEKEGRIEDAAAYYQRMQEGLDPVAHQQLYPYAMSRHAAFLQQQGEDAQALKLLQKALPQINAQAVDFEPLESIYHQLEALSFAAGMTTEARDYQHQLLKLTKARQEEQNNLASQYEKAQMLASYQQHQAAQAQREAQARQELIINLIWVGILSVVLSIFGLFLHRHLRLQKRYRSVRTRLDNIGIALRGATGMRVE